MDNELEQAKAIIEKQRVAIEQYRHRLEELLNQTTGEYYTSVERRAVITLDRYKDIV